MWDNLQFWIWLIVIVVTFLARSKKKPQPPTSAGEPYETPTESKPVSFEDLLREIQQSKSPQPASPQPTVIKQRPLLQPTPAADYEDYDDEIEEEVKEVERVDYKKRDQDETFDAYEKAKLAAFNRASLEETMKLEDTEVKFGQFKGYQQDTTPNVALAYAKDLQDPEGFKKAFILSEILKRKF
jgi:hypothetical protein